MPKTFVLMTMAAAVLVSGCSSRPRNFAPVLAAAPADEKSYQAQLYECRQRLAARMDRSGRLTSAAGGAAVGVGAGYDAGAATAAGTSAGSSSPTGTTDRA